ncbi:cytochrome c oxidase assembly factor CtaG [Pseudogracilibacillus auburnensis]|uniref:cytochrome c oxidase assembly factor CtaG n=1 Tax=Pseudogracilibacillus auburnensis TaxID=1494959 RepID=UPI001A96A9C7|nr:cytochrome c oxidase assembly factor CtaG [Pseudogracilibacillus auburnensis]MBO1003541.1 cytochrome c oxidase assembly factor CtaG [Pseudogracilibacillus auburnensis]
MWLEIQIFGFRALWSPYFLTIIICVALLYFLLTGPMREKFGSFDPPTRNQQIFFYSGMFILYIVKGSPVDLMSHIMMSAHMIQMSFLYFVVPIFIIRGLPVWMWEKFIHLPVIKLLFTFFTLPLIALAIFNSLFSMYHLPAIFDFSKSHAVFHFGISVILFIFAMFMWWPIVTPLKSQDKLNPLIKMGYLLGSILMVSIACALMIFSTKSLYLAYSSQGAWIQALSLCVPTDVLTGLSGTLSGAEMFSPLSAHEDQQLGGIIMMFLQQIIYGFVIAWIFFGWFSKKSLEVDPMPSSLPYSKQ